MSNIVTIPINVLLHCAKLVSTDKNDHINLHAIHFDKGRVIATNGSAMIVYDLNGWDGKKNSDLSDKTFTMCFRPETNKLITRQLKASKKITSVFYDIDACILNTLDAKFQLDKYEGNFLDYKKVIPSASAIDTGNTSLIGVDPEPLTLFDKSVIIHFTTGRDGVMLIEPYQSTLEYPWFGLLMPMNVNVNKHYSHINILKYVHALKEQVEVPICA